MWRWRNPKPRHRPGLHQNPDRAIVQIFAKIRTAPSSAGVLSFVMDGFKTEEISAALNQQGIAVRAGHHCAQPILRRFGLESTVRPSLAFYNNFDDIDALLAALWNIKQGRGTGLI